MVPLGAEPAMRQSMGEAGTHFAAVRNLHRRHLTEAERAM